MSAKRNNPANSRSEALMDLAFAEAGAAKGKTLPNPPVGAVLVKNSKVVASGHTRQAGRAHAEVVALERARGEAAGATLYVTLEPCSHFGRTPPCVRALIEAGVSKVVVACPDPNPLVAGKGLAALRRAGIAVETGLLRERAEEFYGGFFFWIRHGRPRIVLKIAQSLDGRINAGPGLRTPLTGPEARFFAHFLRARADAILVGGKTLRVDDPDLTPRLTGGRHPQILVLSRRREPDFSLRAFSRRRAAKTVLLSPRVPGNLPSWVEHAALGEPGGSGPPGSGNQGALARNLIAVFRDRGYHEVLVEGGRAAWSPFLNGGLCDILHLVTAPMLMPRGEAWGEDLRPGWAKPLEFHRFTPLGPDIATEFRRRVSAP